MLKTPLAIGTAMMFTLLGAAGALHAATPDLGLIPWPKEIRQTQGVMRLTADSRIVYSDASLQPIAQVLADDLANLTDLTPPIAQGQPRPGDIVLTLSRNLQGEAYTLKVARAAVLTAGDPKAMARATATIVQALQLGDDGPALPNLTIQDRPDRDYRGLMIDVARKYHSIRTIKQVVELCRFYKIRYLHLHLTDDQFFMFPSESFPQVTSKNLDGVKSYTRQELEDLVRFANVRGVTIIPELDVPGHSAALNRAMPDLFKIRDTKPYEHHASINIAREETVEAIETMIGEMIEVFDDSPYFHIGGDEADLSLAHQNKYFKAAFEKLGLGDRATGQLYRRFLVQMNEAVRKHGKQTIVWEGFHREPNSRFQIPTNVVVMLYENQFYLPQHLLADGYPVINTAWTPLYVLKKHHWPTQRIYDWNISEFGGYGKDYQNVRWSRVDDISGIIGAQMCSWEQPQWQEIHTLSPRLPAMSERVWTIERQHDFNHFNARLDLASARLNRLFSPIRITSESLADANYNGFVGSTQVTLAAPGQDVTIRYTLDNELPTAESAQYTGPVTIDTTCRVTAQAYDASTGEPVGFPVSAEFTKIEPRYTYRAYLPQGQAWTALPDFASLEPVAMGVIDGNAGVEHILPRYAHFAAVLEGRVDLPADDRYSFDVAGVEDVRIHIDGQLIKNGIHDRTLATLTAGEHDIRIEGLFDSPTFRHELHINLSRGAAAEAQVNVLKRLTEAALATERASSDGNVVHFKRHFPADQHNQVRGYVARIVKVNHDSVVRLITGSDDGLRIWVNGTLVQEINKVRGHHMDADVAEAQLRTGANELLVEVSQDGGGWSLSLRMEDQQGNPLVLESDGRLTPASGNRNQTYVRDWHFAPETRPWQPKAAPENNLPLLPLKAVAN